MTGFFSQNFTVLSFMIQFNNLIGVFATIIVKSVIINNVLYHIMSYNSILTNYRHSSSSTLQYQEKLISCASERSERASKLSHIYVPKICFLQCFVGSRYLYIMSDYRSHRMFIVFFLDGMND